jgi:hypothetical protein
MSEAEAVEMVAAMIRTHLAPEAVGHREEMLALRIVRALVRYGVVPFDGVARL